MYGTPRHCDFRHLMALYEANYVRFAHLVPGMAQGRASGRSDRGDGLDLHLRMLEHSVYTSTLELTYYFTGLRDAEGSAPVPEPELVIRLYHDARLAEAISCRDVDPGPRNRMPFEGKSTCVGEKLLLNQFLEKWLIYALRQGHCFDEACTGSAGDTLLHPCAVG